MYLFLPFVITLALVSSTNRLRINISGMRPITFTIINTNLSYYILGFRPDTDKLVDMGTETITYTTIVSGSMNTTSLTSIPTPTSLYY